VPQDGTKCGTICATTYHKMSHNTAQNVPQHGTKSFLDLCATGRHKMCHSSARYKTYFLTYVPQEGTKCATTRHKMCHKEGTKCSTGRHKMCHRKAQNVPQHGTKRLNLCTTAQEVTKCPFFNRLIRLKSKKEQEQVELFF
jgi:hypothetical protein